MENQLVLKSIGQLFKKYSFFIPAYQRGYRWTETQVKNLLIDIWQFYKKKKDPGEFYCLQPIVVKKKDDKFEVIDGQQRLTTIFLIIKYLEDTIPHVKKNFSFSSPYYDTTEDRKDFLDNVKIRINDKEICNSNIDFFHIYKAYETIKNWFEDENNDINLAHFVSTLIEFSEKEDQIDTTNNVRVIWYEINKEEKIDPIDIFDRLNKGKIPLTNAELIKALFLQDSNFEKDDKAADLKKIKIASEWDIIEKTLQDDAFWFFIYNPENPLQYDNRIEYIFDLMKRRTKESEYYHTFNKFFDDFSKDKSKEKPNIDNIWLKIKEYFLIFEAWYKDYELFHYIGYLIACIKKVKNEIKHTENIINTIVSLIKESKEKTKKDFKTYLKKEIKNQVNFNIDELNFNDDKYEIKKVLLLFNIQTVLETQKSDIESQKSYMRFPFHKYKLDNWEIEHVRSQNDKEDTGKIKDDPNEWVESMFDYFVGSNDETEINGFISKSDISENEMKIKNLINKLIDYRKENDNNKKQAKFYDAYSLAQDIFKESNIPDNIHSISNLALLDAATNRSYGNAFFPIKRERIIKNDRSGIFVPICTKNLFLKYYTKKFGEARYWNSDDADDYLKAIKDTLKEFLLYKIKPMAEDE